MKVKKASGRLGTQLRGKLATAYGLRGHQLADLYYVYSPHTDRDWVLRSDLCFDHFLLTEADPTVIDVDYSPEIQTPTLGPIKFDAIVRYNDGVTQWHHISSEPVKPPGQISVELLLLRDAAEHSGAQLKCLDQLYFQQYEMRLWNWRRAIAWISAARGTSLALYMNEVAAFIYPRGLVTLAEISKLGSQDHFPIYAAAAFRLVQRGVLVENLDEFPISLLTTFRIRG